MTKPTLMITMNADLRGALRAADKRATARSYQCEVLNFETAASIFGSSPNGAGRWHMRCKGKGRCRCGNWHAVSPETSGAFMTTLKCWPSWVSSSAQKAAPSCALSSRCTSMLG